MESINPAKGEVTAVFTEWYTMQPARLWMSCVQRGLRGLKSLPRESVLMMKCADVLRSRKTVWVKQAIRPVPVYLA